MVSHFSYMCHTFPKPSLQANKSPIVIQIHLPKNEGIENKGIPIVSNAHNLTFLCEWKICFHPCFDNYYIFWVIGTSLLWGCRGSVMAVACSGSVISLCVGLPIDNVMPFVDSIILW